MIEQKQAKARMSKKCTYVQDMWAINCSCAISFDFSISASISAEEGSFLEQR